ncbi:MAG: metallophosphoesterase family protein [Clostridia bacterium]|nr:metallophosphoesterase family protein [Clostridia bacterium]
MIYFTSDLHLGHERIIELCQRPFESVEEMDEALIENWNRRVKRNDTVYILGDLLWDKKRVDYYLERLLGKKILIRGNHDSTWAKREESLCHFESILQYLEISHHGHSVTMCHYPMLEWKASREPLGKKVGYHVHGHIHNRISSEYDPLYTHPCALNAGVDVNGYKPVTFSELVENNLKFKLSALTSEEDRAHLLEASSILGI